MTRVLSVWVVALWVLLCAVAPAIQADQLIPSLQARVTDVAEVLTPAQRDHLEQRLAAFEQRTGNQLALLIVPTTQPETIEQYSIRVVEQWKLGKQARDNGVLLLVAHNDRALRIEVGYGLEGTLTDLHSSRIIREVIVPRFQKGDYFGGLDAGLNAIMSRLESGTAVDEAPPESSGESTAGVSAGSLPFLLFAAIVVGRILRVFFSGLLSGVLSGAIVGALTYLVSGSLVLAVIFGIAAVVLGLASWAGHRGGFARHGGHGWGGPGGGFGRGGGGFGGGGGGFGGGGASGRW